MKPVVPAPQATLESPCGGDQAGGLAVPPENGEGEGSVQDGDVVDKEPDAEEDILNAKKKWMDFEEFCRCFKWVLYFVLNEFRP